MTTTNTTMCTAPVHWNYDYLFKTATRISQEVFEHLKPAPQQEQSEEFKEYIRIYTELHNGIWFLQQIEQSGGPKLWHCVASLQKVVNDGFAFLVMWCGRLANERALLAAQ